MPHITQVVDRLPEVGEKPCKKCGVTKPYSSFGIFKRFGGHRCYQSYCKSCACEKRKAWVAKYPYRAFKLNERRRIFKSHRHTHLQREFGISEDQYNQMLAEQGGVCAICKEGEKLKTKKGVRLALAVDHCHVTGRIRGLLCSLCNRIMGHVDKHGVETFVKYLRDE